MTKKTEDLLKILIDNKKEYWYTKNEDFLLPLDEALLTDDEKVVFVRALMKDKHDFFSWYTLICEVLKSIKIYSDDFVEVIQDIIVIICNDMAQGQFIDLLIDYGKRDNYLDLYNKLIAKVKNEVVYHYAGILLGGRGLDHPDEIIKYIDKNKSMGDEKQEKILIVTSYVNASRIFIDKHHITYDDFFKELLKYAAQPERPEGLRIEAVRLAFDYYRYNPTFAYEQLLILVDTKSEMIFRMIAEMLWLKGLDDTHVHEFTLFKSVVEKTQDNFVGQRCFYYLAKNNKYNVDISFNCFIKLVDKELYNNSSEQYYALEMMGKEKFDVYKLKFLEYIASLDDINKIGTLSELEFLFNESFGKQTKDKDADVKELINAIILKRKDLWNKKSVSKND